MNKRRLLGQHMLTDTDIIKTILDSAELNKDDVVYEVGTGNGVLTAQLCKNAGKVISCEVDKNLLEKAQKTLVKYSNLILISGDGFKLNYDFNVFISNLPYSKSKTAIEWLAMRNFDKAVIMVQREFAEKILAGQQRNYRAISALAQYCFGAKLITNVSKNSFYPRPKVDSVLLKLVQKQKVDKNVIRALELLFSYKGKKVRNAIKKFKLDRNLEFGEKRIEKLTPEELIGLAKIVAQERLLQTI
ncbi:MAG: 16S rRNA (adenine(1518)-N(6)/adenine(1519)-N(6))-dimethyltransferase RsmA [Nitrososphaerales archaeon]